MGDIDKNDQTLTLQEVTNIMENGVFENFISLRECNVFEAKSNRPYDLPDILKARIELIKDVASFANGTGGYIICGLNTQKNQGSPHDYVVSLDLINKNDFYDKSMLKGIVKSNIYPKINIEVKWYPFKDNNEFGLGVILIPKQDEDKKHFIIKINEVDGSEIKECFGIPVRTDDQIKWLKVQELYKLSKRLPNKLQDHHQSISNQIAEAIDLISAISIESEKDENKITSKIEETIHGNR